MASQYQQQQHFANGPYHQSNGTAGPSMNMAAAAAAATASTSQPFATQQPQSAPMQQRQLSAGTVMNGTSAGGNAFMKTLLEIHRRRNTPIQEPVTIENRQLDLQQVYTFVMSLGGSLKVHNGGAWATILDKLGFARDPSGNQPESRIKELMTVYQRVLLPLEQVFMQVARQQQQAQAAATSAGPSKAQRPAAPAMPRPPVSHAPSPAGPSSAMSPPSFSQNTSSLPTVPEVTSQPNGTIKREHVDQKVTGNATATDEPPARHRRKRQRIEYRPITRRMDATVGGWDLGLWDELIPALAKRRHQRDLGDLGMIDTHSLTMSLKSRMDTEVAYAMNVLTLLSLHSAVPGDRRQLVFVFSMAGDLLDEVIELLEETALGSDPTSSGAEMIERKFRTYKELFRLVDEEEGELRDLELEPLSEEGPMRPAALILSITNFIRNMTILPDNVVACARVANFVEVLVRVASLPLRRDSKGKSNERHGPVLLSAREALAVRKDVMQIFSVFGLFKDAYIQLELLDRDVQEMLYHLLLSFVHPCDLFEQPYFDLSFFTAPVSQLALSSRAAPYVELGLVVFARTLVRDANRQVVRSLKSPVDLHDLFEAMIWNLPMTEEGFQRLTSEDGFLAIENLTAAMYNLVCIAPSQVKERIRDRPSFIRSLIRVIKRLVGTTLEPDQNVFAPLCERCVAMLGLIDETGSTTVASAGSDLPWYGLPMFGDDDLDERRLPDAVAAPNQPNEGANKSAAPLLAGSVKAQGPPKGRRTGPPILASERDSVFDMLKTTVPTIFLQLEPMLGFRTK